MRLIIDTEASSLIHETAENRRELSLYSPEAFELLGTQWLRVGWTQKYSYSFSWLGRPIVQLPEDIIRIQEVIHRVQPDVIIETGIAHGGSLVFYASLCFVLQRGHVIGVDIDIRSHNRQAIMAHPLAHLITLVEGDSVAPAIIQTIREAVLSGETVLVLLDSCHTKAHVLAELQAYSPMVTIGSYIVATDGIMADLADAPGGKSQWKWDNPQEAAREFVRLDHHFRIEVPPMGFNDSALTAPMTYWPSAYLRRVC